MIAIGSDHAGYALKCEIIKFLEEKGVEYNDCGCNGNNWWWIIILILLAGGFSNNGCGCDNGCGC